MINPSEENLLGYLIRANEEHEQEELAEQIRTDAKLRKDCQLLQSGLALPAADEEPLDPPPLLAKLTCDKLWNLVDSGEFPKLPALAKDAVAESAVVSATLATTACDAAKSPAITAARSTPVAGHLDNSPEFSKRRWQWLDLAVASSVLVVIGGVLSTQTLSSRNESLSASCRYNMQTLYTGLANHASMNGDRLPTAEERGPLAFAGMYGPTLRKAGYLQNERTLICPESRLAQDIELRLPTLDDLQRATIEELPRLQQRAGGTYFFVLGYVDHGKYHTLKLRNRMNYPLLADPAALDKGPGLNHGQRGQNVLFENGCVRFLTHCKLGDCGDHYFENDDGQEAAGLHENDSVLVGSGIGPLR